MQEEKETSIQIKVNKSVSKELKNMARQKGIVFSSYVRKIITDHVQKEKKDKE